MKEDRTVKSVAVIGAGAAGAAAAAALKAENYFDWIRVLERRETAGGTWIYDPSPPPLPLHPGALPPQIDQALRPPKRLPATVEPSSQERYHATPIYRNLTTNVPDVAMCFTDCPFAYGPFVPHWIPRQYIEGYFSRHRMDSLLSTSTTVEDLVAMDKHRWRLVLRRHDAARGMDDWWEEQFDAVILANGHYTVPFVPSVSGLSDYMSIYPGRVEHSKVYRSPGVYSRQRVLIIGNSASGIDIRTQLRDSGLLEGPIYVSRRSRSRWDGDKPPPGVIWKPVISEYRSDGSIVFEDGTKLRNIDKVIYCTGYKPSFPFWNESNGNPLWDYKEDRLHRNYQHTFFSGWPTLGIIGMPRVLTFRSFEYQAIALARLWSGRNAHSLPPLAEQREWEIKRAQLVRSEQRRFHQIEWDCGETMDWFRWLFDFAGLPLIEGEGRYPPVLGPQTRWAIDHVRKYPEPGKPPVEGRSEGAEDDRDDWVVLHPAGGKDSLHFL